MKSRPPAFPPDHRHVRITKARVGGRVGNPRPGTHGAGAGPGSRPGSGLTETATGPGSTLTARGGADSLWLQRFAFLTITSSWNVPLSVGFFSEALWS